MSFNVSISIRMLILTSQQSLLVRNLLMLMLALEARTGFKSGRWGEGTLYEHENA